MRSDEAASVFQRSPWRAQRFAQNRGKRRGCHHERPPSANRLAFTSNWKLEAFKAARSQQGEVRLQRGTDHAGSGADP